MPRPPLARAALAAALVVGAGAAIVAGRTALASDHQDTPEVELNPRMDVNDVYAFPGSSPDRIVFAVTTSSPIQGTNASFDEDLLYQIKIDTNGDAVEDRVIQFTFDGQGAAQVVNVRGPVAPAMTGTRAALAGEVALTGAVGATLGSATGLQVFAGLRDDPFFIDLEQFFRILPDRRPSTGPLATPQTAQATRFRGPAPTFTGETAVDFVRTFNALALVVELPKSQILASTAATDRIGVWATISR